MPFSAPKPCNHPLCGDIVNKGSYCDKHKKHARARDHRVSAAKRGYGRKWRKARMHHLYNHPLCEEHRKRGMIVAATEVDHKIAHKGDMNLFWDVSNWQSLCKSCHSRKTATQDMGAWTD